MIKMGLTRKEKIRLNKILENHHSIYIRLQLLDLEHKYLMDLSHRLLGGQVTIDADAEVSRAVTLELLDPQFKLKLDADSPDDGSMYFTRMFRIIYVVRSADGVDSFDIPIFCGPLSKVDRQGPILSVEAKGKEHLSSASMWLTKTFKKGLRKTQVIELVLKNLGGERRLDIPNRKPKLPRNLSMNFEKTPWKVAKWIARGMNLQLFYDGRGVARLRKIPSKSVYVFRDDGVLLSAPTATYDAEDVINAVEVIGGKPKGSKKKVRWRVVAPRSHALSPWTMGRWDVPRYLPERITDDSIRSESEARAVAKARLRNALIESVEVAFDCLPVPYLEEMDLCRVHSDSFAGTFRLRKMTIPLTADGVSSIGYLRRVTPNRRQARIRTRRRRKARK